MKTYRGSRSIAPLILTSAVDEDELSTWRSGRFDHEKELRYPFSRRLDVCPGALPDLYFGFEHFRKPSSVAAPFKALTFGRSPAGIAGLNPAGAATFVYCECCVLHGVTPLRRSDPSSKGVLPSVWVCVCVSICVWSGEIITLYNCNEEAEEVKTKYIYIYFWCFFKLRYISVLSKARTIVV